MIAQIDRVAEPAIRTMADLEGIAFAYSAAPSKCGEFTADNVSRMLNECATDANDSRWSTVRSLLVGGCLDWRRMTPSANFKRMAI